MNTLIYHTLTTGFWDFRNDPTHPSQPKMIGLGAILYDDEQSAAIGRLSCLVTLPKGHSVPEMTAGYHGITTEMVRDWGIHVDEAMKRFRVLAEQAAGAATYGEDVHSAVILAALHRAKATCPTLPHIDLMKIATGICRIPHHTSRFKFPKLGQAYEFFAKEPLIIDREQGGVDIVSQSVDAVVTIYQGIRKYKADKKAKSAETASVRLDVIP